MRRTLHTLLFVLLALLFSRVTAIASPFDFAGRSGGTLSYIGGSNPIAMTGGNIFEVFGLPGSNLGISRGSLDFVTGNWLSGSRDPNTGIITNLFGGGGNFTISGAIPSLGIQDVTELVRGSFAGPVTNAISNGFSTLTGMLLLPYIHPSLVNYFSPGSVNSGTGAIVHLSSYVGEGPADAGRPFSGTGASSNIGVSPIPEPASMVLLGSGLLGVGMWLRRRHRGNK